MDGEYEVLTASMPAEIPQSHKTKTDGAPAVEVLAELLRLALLHDKDSRIIGNVRAGDIVNALIPLPSPENLGKAVTELQNVNNALMAIIDLREKELFERRQDLESAIFEVKSERDMKEKALINLQNVLHEIEELKRQINSKDFSFASYRT